MSQRLRYYLLALSFLFLTNKSYGQVELSALVGPAFNYASVNHAPDSAGTSPVKCGLPAGLAATLEANLPMQYGFRLKAGIRLMHKELAFEQDYNLLGITIKNQWFIEGFSLKTPIHLYYPVVDRRYQIIAGIGIAAVKNWLNYEHASISGRGGGNGTIASSFDADFITYRYQPVKNSLSLAGELSAEIIPSFFPQLSLGFVWHHDILKQGGQIIYENQYYVQNGSITLLNFRSKGSFEIKKTGYFMVQLKYTFAGKSKEKKITDFEDDGAE